MIQSNRRWRGRAARAVTLVVALTLVPAVADAQEAPPPSTTTSSTTSTTSTTTTSTVPGAAAPTTTTSTTSTTTPAATTTPPPDPDEAPAEAAPEAVVVAPPTAPPSPDIARIQAAIATQLRAARREVGLAQRERDAAAERVAGVEARIADAVARTEALNAADRAAIDALRAAKADMQDRASEAFMRGSLSDLDGVLRADGPGDLLRRMELVTSALEADQAAVDAYKDAKEDLDAELVQLTTDLTSADVELTAAREALALLDLAVAEAKQRVELFEAGSAVAVAGFVFPVGDPHSFIDSFGAARMPGSPYAHTHQGTDIMAPHGTPLFACERGVVTKMGTDVLGGTKLWIVGASGTRYYYAHLAAFAPGLVEGQTVEAGTLIGFVGDTGNARGGAAHLHFEIHPPGLPAVNPYPVLSVVDGARGPA
jgi:murein DD-endopeptidase MepM/ murein hydrolase activator NlpD